MKSTTVTAATAKDSGAICALSERELGYPYPLPKAAENLKKCLRDPTHCILVAKVEGQAVGYIHLCLYQSLYGDLMANVLGLAVQKEYTRRGIGKQLLAAGETWAKEQRATGVRLNSGFERSNAHKFYLSQGYKNRKTQLNFVKTL